MPVPSQTPGRINVDENVRYVCVVENSATQLLFRVLLMPKLQHDQNRRCPVRSCQFVSGTNYFLRYPYTAFDRRVAAVRHDQLRQRPDPRAAFGWKPDKTRPEMRSVLVEVPTE